MADTRDYFVLWQHDGDRAYKRGDTRTALPADVKHLVDAGVLREAGAKAEAAPLNKAESAPLNKAEDDASHAKRRGRPPVRRD